MAVPYSNTKLRVPKGFQNILEGLARECLRSQPDDIFEFGAKYFEQLLQVREQTGHDPAIHGARLEDRFYNNDSFQSMSVDSSDPQQQEAALKIQTEVRRHQAAQEVDSMREEDAATKIQAGVRGHQDREKVADMKESSSEKANTTATSEEVDIDLNDPDVADAAIKIQAGFKGYKARKEVKEKKEAHSAKSEPLAPTEATEAELNEAASRIQAGFRGHKTRQEIKSMQNQSSESEKEENAEQPEDKEIDLDLNDPDLNEAAIRIQAGFRGHQARMEVKNQMASETKVEGKDNTEEEEVDIDLNDPEVANAAIKIQAGFKGYKARKEVLEMKSEEVPPSETKAEKEETTPEKEGADKSEEIDIDLNDPEVEKAAVKIQASFKGYQTRKSTKDSKEGVKSDESMETPKQEEAKQEEEVDIDLKDPDTEQAALKIQAGFRGYKTRKEVKEKMEEAKSSEKQDEEKTEEKPEEKTEEKQEETTEAKPEESKTGEEIDIDLNDPEVEKAATKIQAGFKGYKVRKEVKDKQGEETTETEEAKPSESKEEVDIDLQDPEVEKAATKIQAGFKGYKTRKEVKEKMDSQKDEGQE